MTATVVMVMNTGLTYEPIAALEGALVNSDKPRYTKMKFSDSCASVLKMYFVARWVLRLIVW